MRDMTANIGTTNLAAARALVDACLRAGHNHFFIAPGSRCTPLTLAIAENRQLNVTQHFDERGLSFACLGYGRATGRAGIFVCTSGTAAANALPACVEAANDHVPLILLTADRPAELRDNGANQSIDQVRLFGGFTEWTFDIPCPDDMVSLDLLRSVLAHALKCSQSGPVHLNAMFREPFGAAAASVEIPSSGPVATARAEYQVQLPTGTTIVMAGGCRREEALAARTLADQLACPFLSDITNGVRGLPYDVALLRDQLPPAEVVVHVGARVVSKRWHDFLRKHPPQSYLHFWPHRSRRDPLLLRPQVLSGSILGLCLGVTNGATDVNRRFLTTWQKECIEAWHLGKQIIDDDDDLTEPWLALTLARQLPSAHGLVLGNSLPVREFDQWAFWPDEHQISVAANRGASGIDGLIATAVGYSIGQRQPTTALIGDVSALHDLNSLALLRSSPVPVILIIVNNDGGGIFHFLPIAEQSEHFERYFATPHGRAFNQVAEMFGLPYECITARNDFIAAYERSLAAQQSCLLEVRTNRHQNRQVHQTVERALQSTP